ncbi:hypothetical protein J5J10_04555 [Ciceribacter sp. L1K23]|uniref:hypothetical protein n=1 Tax=Ciceribacter sp. L1K23 TaxID=2820276 RepID=UPI001B813BAF|nr:hypothetical protein [Ciceribacter sp. L1K23]MBR0554945.1 hypothetical protein [Ciceribacter sp. L1K23]
MVDDGSGMGQRCRRAGRGEKIILLALALIAIVGLVLVADGLYLKTKVLASEMMHERATVLRPLADER